MQEPCVSTAVFAAQDPCVDEVDVNPAIGPGGCCLVIVKQPGCMSKHVGYMSWQHHELPPTPPGGANPRRHFDDTGTLVHLSKQSAWADRTGWCQPPHPVMIRHTSMHPI